jgi:hypothetical protein
MKFRHFCTLFLYLARARALLVHGVMLLTLVLAPLARAAEVDGLYVANATVTSRDNERERQQGFAAGLREVLVKLTGRRDTLDNPVVTRALGSPQSYVATWAYNTLPSTDPFAQPGQAAQIEMQVSFFEAGVQQLLNEAGIAMWPRNRPDTLLWITIQDELGERYRATTLPEEGGDVITAVRAEAARRGVPVLLPLLDFDDLRNLSIEQMWNFDLNALRIASNRYGAESILALRVFRSLSGDVIAKAVYIFRDQVLEFDVLESPLEPFVEGSIDLVAANLASYYAILLSGAGNGTEEQVLLTVDAVDSAADYAGLMQYLNGLAAISGVQVLGAKGASIELQLKTGGQARQLIESIALGRSLIAQGEVTRIGPQVRMHYRWSQP